MITYSFDPYFELMITTWTGKITDEELVLSFKRHLPRSWNPGTNHIADLLEADVSSLTKLGVHFLVHILDDYLEYKRLNRMDEIKDTLILCHKDAQKHIMSLYSQVHCKLKGKIKFCNTIDEAVQIVKDNHEKNN